MRPGCRMMMRRKLWYGMCYFAGCAVLRFSVVKVRCADKRRGRKARHARIDLIGQGAGDPGRGGLIDCLGPSMTLLRIGVRAFVSGAE